MNRELFGRSEGLFVWLRYGTRYLVIGANLGLTAAVVGVAYALATVGQLVELYAVELSRPKPNALTLWCAVGAASMFSLIIYAASRRLPRLFLYSDLAPREPRWASPWRELVSFIAMLAPWVGMAFGLAEAERLLNERAAPFVEAQELLQARAEMFSPAYALLSERVNNGYRILAASGGALAIALGLWWWLCGAGRPAYWRSPGYRVFYAIFLWTARIAVGLALTLCGVLAVEPAFGPISTLGELWGIENAWSAGLQKIGPIACVFLALSVLFSLVLVVFILFSALATPEFVGAALVGVLVLVFFFVPAASDGSRNAQATAAADRAASKFDEAFDTWANQLLAKYQPLETPEEIPVYIVAASGGGAYAAAHAAYVLGALQDENPQFARHVFAISGVSGGSVGATLFRAVDEATPASPTASRGAFGGGPRAQAVRQIILGDHLGPLVVETAGSMITKLTGGRHDGRSDRAAALRATYLEAVRSAHAPNMDRENAKKFLASNYLSSWSIDAANTPALVLNATSVEQGEPMAFAPFELFDASRGVVRSYAEWFKGPGEPVDALQAAIVSARFPGVLPAFSPATRPRANFVDGGYADSSGSDVALAIYRAVERRIGSQARFKPLKLRLLLLSGSYRSDAPPSAGTALVDTLAPLYAVLKVRGQQAQRAVDRVCVALRSEIATFQQPCERLSADAQSPLRVIELDTVSLRLPLAWQISAATHETIVASVGRPEDCDHPFRGPAPLDATAEQRREHKVIRLRSENACTLAWVLESLNP